ncbi:MAG: proteasome accessory factor PafA2 family protein, partial [Candidatus Pacearchaeota archaeon]
MVDRLFTDEQIEYAVENAPQDTRARFRGLLVSKPDLQGKSVRWDRVTYHSKKRKMMQKCVECPI